MQNCRKISFSEIWKKVSETERIKYSFKNFGYLPSFIVYGITLIFLLKISQIVLGWRF